jgi:hypothetical protein
MASFGYGQGLPDGLAIAERLERQIARLQNRAQ